MPSPLVECVPNFSDGRDRKVIDAIAAAITSVDGVTLLDGAPGVVVEAAVRAGRASVEHIDMSRHHGAHPRFGAMDVCPFVPVRDITMAEGVELARGAGRGVGGEGGR